MEYEVRITLQAQAHLREIRDYIAQKLLAPEAAKNTVQRLGIVMASLSQMPKRVPLVEEEPWHSEGVRVRAVRNFLIYFALRFACARVSRASCFAALARSGFALLIRLPPSQWTLSDRDMFS